MSTQTSTHTVRSTATGGSAIGRVDAGSIVQRGGDRADGGLVATNAAATGDREERR